MGVSLLTKTSHLRGTEGRRFVFSVSEMMRYFREALSRFFKMPFRFFEGK